MRWLAGLVVALLANGSFAQDIGTSRLGLESDTVIPPSEAAGTGAVIVLYADKQAACSGMLVTPSWVLTNAHCRAVKGDVVRLGNLNDPEAPVAEVAESFAHPRYERDKADFDVRLLRLYTGLFPEAASGQVWTWYARDLVRGSMRAFEDRHGEGVGVDIYAYGVRRDGAFTDFGVLRYGRMRIDDYRDRSFEVDSGSVFVQGGDSGAAVLFPAFSRPTVSDRYEILGVLARACDNFLCNSAEAADAFSIQPWFDQTIDWRHGPRVPAAMIVPVNGAG